MFNESAKAVDKFSIAGNFTGRLSGEIFRNSESDMTEAAAPVLKSQELVTPWTCIVIKGRFAELTLKAEQIFEKEKTLEIANEQRVRTVWKLFFFFKIFFSTFFRDLVKLNLLLQFKTLQVGLIEQSERTASFTLRSENPDRTGVQQRNPESNPVGNPGGNPEGYPAAEHKWEETLRPGGREPVDR